MKKIIILFSLTTLLFSLTKAEETPESETGETLMFQAETSRLLDIIINSLYTQKDIFLREAISNASDALDKIRFLSISEPDMTNEEPEMSIKIRADLENNTLTITDTGIGMNKSDLINNLGTIARSGTTQFLEAIKQNGDLNLIGQFGVGFYSYFLVANKVTVYTKKFGEGEWVWESSAGSTFNIYENTEETLKRGTRVVLDIKSDMKEYLEVKKLKELVKKFSEFINFPIYLYCSKEISKEVEIEEEEEKPETTTETPETTDETPEAETTETPETPEETEPKKDSEVELEVEDNDDPILDEEQKKKTKTVKETVWEYEQLNENKAIWLKPIEEIEPEEYKKFYKSLTNDYQDPLDWIHFKAEGEIEFTALLFIPKTAPMAFMQNQSAEEQKTNLKLYVRRVLISENFEDLMPRYLNFIKGVVDSDDLPLNVSRETLQQMRIIKTIKKKLVKKIIQKLQKYSTLDIEDEYDEDEEKMTDAELDELDQRIENRKTEMKDIYNKFWTEFGKGIKAGIVEDIANRKNLASISRWYSTFNKTETLVSLESYIERKKEDQNEIYYLGGDKKKILENPVLKGLVEKNYEVLVLSDSIDEYTVQTLDKYKDLNLVNIGKSGFELPQNEEETKNSKKLERYYQPLTNWLKNILSSEVENVKVNFHSQESPMVVLAGKQGYSAHMEKIIKSQATITKDDRFNMFDKQKRNIEINPYHPFMRELLERVKSGVDPELEESAKLLFEIALLQAGFELKEPSKFTNKFYRVMSDSFGISRDLEKVEIDLNEIEDEEEVNAEASVLDGVGNLNDLQDGLEEGIEETLEAVNLGNNMEGDVNIENELNVDDEL